MGSGKESPYSAAVDIKAAAWLTVRRELAKAPAGKRREVMALLEGYAGPLKGRRGPKINGRNRTPD